MIKSNLIFYCISMHSEVRKGFRNHQIFLSVLLISPLLLLSSCKEKTYAEVPEESPGEQAAELKQEDLEKRGEYLVTSIGCADCHSPKRMGRSGPEEIAELKLSGYPSDAKLPEVEKAALEKGWMLFNPDLTAGVGPWGISFAANITSDETGIGNWTFDQFKTAMRKGKYKGLENGRDLLPPMPWQNFANLSDDDLKAMFTYLQSTKPVSNIVPAPIPPDKLVALAR